MKTEILGDIDSHSKIVKTGNDFIFTKVKKKSKKNIIVLKSWTFYSKDGANKTSNIVLLELN